MSTDFDVEFDKMKKSLMKYVHFHRYGRRISINVFFFILSCLILLVFNFYLGVYSYYEFNSFFIDFLADYLQSYKIESFSISFFEKYTISLKYIFIEGRYPNIYDSMFVLVFFGILGVVLYSYRRKILPFFVWYIFFIIPLFSSVFYFLLFYKYFPYTVREFSILYILLHLGINFFIVSINSFLLSLVTISLGQVFFNILFSAFIILYSIVFGYLRYYVFLLILNKFSYLYFANLFFTFGPLIDFIYVISFYSLYTSLLVKFIYRDTNLWKFI
ncbi:MAG: hypothetical protein N2169_02245 [bacterium]|nr:hypothetical protein [bacterium]